MRAVTMCLALGALAVALAAPQQQDQPAKTYTEEDAKQYLNKLNAELLQHSNMAAIAEWAYASNITDETLQNKLKVAADTARFQKEAWKETVKYPWTTYKDPNVRRQFKKLSVLGAAALPEDKYEKLDKIVSDMQNVYSTAKICDFKNREKCDLNLEPELTLLLAKSRDPEELKHVWAEFRKEAGDKVRKQFVQYVELTNEAARLNNFSDASEEWVKDYESAEFRNQIQELWLQLRPLYEQIHAYVRRRLNEQYGDAVVKKDGLIPAHLLGNMWSQTWGNVYDISTPYPGKQPVDATSAMVEKGFDAIKMFKMSEEFFTSLNLSAMPDTFWQRSILKKPEGRSLICHASAWDFYDGEDFRIKQCTRITHRDLITAHHEMGHVQYYLQYKHLPKVYRRGANSGFHEAVGDTIALSVSTPKHLRKVGLLPADSKDDPQSELNYLYNMGLEKIAFLPFGYLMDLWRWDVFKGKTSPDNYNCEWWRLRQEYQGIEAPVDRSEDNFDPGSKYHTIASVPYIRYFVSYVIQFQFHAALCEKAGQFDPKDPERMPLHQCDIYQSKEAGNLFGKMLSLGSSKPWPEAMEIVTGQRKMDASGLMAYFRPLLKWLEEENKKTGEKIGWDASAPRHGCKRTSSEAKAAPAPAASSAAAAPSSSR
ncbi:angiotensin-converting enzyme-like isoform X2 [Frankliniella occidentalis]|uniref:Angiotensin-converting enzyme n=1 Tax=Frankliniella occidentalis TaxID=133901 RepID=A0A9C6XAN6_FRAOC|nr:angiotensin-converting enzyme-like isoform X2 [Frankliniella occidentalis]